MTVSAAEARGSERETAAHGVNRRLAKGELEKPLLTSISTHLFDLEFFCLFSGCSTCETIYFRKKNEPKHGMAK